FSAFGPGRADRSDPGVYRGVWRLRYQLGRGTALSALAGDSDVSLWQEFWRMGTGGVHRHHHHPCLELFCVALFPAGEPVDGRDVMEISQGQAPRISAERLRRLQKELARVWRAYFFPLLLLGFFVIVVGLPLLMAVLWSLVDPDNPWSYPNPFPTSLSLAQWEFVFKYTDIVPAIITSFTIAPIATLCAFLLALPTAYAIGRYEFR